MQQVEIGLIGLAVMGQNLALNIRDKGFSISVFNRSPEKTKQFIEQNAGISYSFEIEDFIKQLKKPRKIIMMVKAGKPVDELIEQLLPHLEENDILIDGGNSFFLDTERRIKYLNNKKILYVGTGISGGETGARFGPSMMPSGNVAAWAEIKEIFQKVAAQVDNSPCCEWIGDGGSGHYVKMVHNGIEYGDMQLISEAYFILRYGLDLQVSEIQNIFETWNQGVLDSYLIEITAKILKVTENGEPLIDKILDVAGQKGTGQWTSASALELGVPLTLITEAVFSRYLSTLYEDRQILSKKFPKLLLLEKNLQIQAVHDALYAAKIISYTQGFMLLKQAAKTYGWSIPYAEIAGLWRGGCIIRSRFLGEIQRAFSQTKDLQTLVFDDFFGDALKKADQGWRETLIFAIKSGISTPALSAALAFYDGLRSATLPANLLQAQRDFFGAHTFERIDQPRGTFFHHQWEQN
jgi:6-phosphogluconate dehydrogenase